MMCLPSSSRVPRIHRHRCCICTSPPVQHGGKQAVHRGATPPAGPAAQPRLRRLRRQRWRRRPDSRRGRGGCTPHLGLHLLRHLHLHALCWGPPRLGRSHYQGVCCCCHVPAGPRPAPRPPPPPPPHSLQVRSCSLDTWLPEQVEFMGRTGNARANAYWEARGLAPGSKPKPTTPLPGACPCGAGGLRLCSLGAWRGVATAPHAPLHAERRHTGSRRPCCMT